MKRTATERLLQKVRRGENGCWVWTASVRPDGYGQFDHRGAHRAAYELLVGPIPPGLQIDHLCRNTLCVNPAHLEPVTPRENTMRGNTPARRLSERTHCALGHPLSGENLATRRDGSRKCRKCHAAYMWRYRRGL